MTRKASLTSLKAGEQALICRLKFENKTLLRRISDLGLSRGTYVTVLANDAFNPILISLSGSRVALEKNCADRVEVIVKE